MARWTVLLFLVGCSGSQTGVVKYNQEPAANILSPTSGTEVDEGNQVNFQGKVVDDTTPSEELVVQWSSDLDGLLTDNAPPDANGSVSFATSNLSAGNHTISLKAVDKEGEEGVYTIKLSVLDVPDAPTISVVHPIPGETGVEERPFSFTVQVGDEQDDLSSLQVEFSSNLVTSGPFCTPAPDQLGVATCDYPLPAGDNTLTFLVTDADGLTARTNVLFPVAAKTSIDDDGDHFSEDQGDCDDTDSNVNPLATEIYNNIDDNCNGVIDEGTSNFDDDFDGQRELDGDCDDGDPATYLGAPEQCDGRDNDCDNVVDEATVCYDDDGDGYTENQGDCDDGSAVVYPKAPEVADGADNNCDGNIDEGTVNFDDDFDGYTENAGDCDDADATVNPGALETCNGHDDNCDGASDEENASSCTTYYYDQDGDAYGSDTVSGKCYCYPTGYYTSVNNYDCNDYNSSANPAQTTASTSQTGNGKYDWNCDGKETKQDTTLGSCSGAVWVCSWNTGWDGGAAACGANGSYITDCSGFLCSKTTQTRTQSCL